MPRSLALETTKQVGKRVLLQGWVNTRRDMGKIVFIDLRDRSGLIQVVLVPQELSKNTQKLVEKIRPEFVLEIEGMVQKRGAKQINKNLPTGEVEVLAKELKIISQSKTPPFPLETDGYKINEELRLRYRYLDLRRKRMLENLVWRQKVKNFIREYLTKKDFIEIDTPLLTKSTPEGARDFIVPSRMYPGKFYALPQSPQQYKQLLMVAGVEKYFQFPRCLRDEDLRSDRVFEFDQLDIEMSFVDQKDVLDLTEDLVIEVSEKVLNKKVQEKPFPRFTFDEAMKKYKTDSPDLRKNKKDRDTLVFCWIVDFPMFEYKKGDKRWAAAHHPFTAICDEDLLKLDDSKKIGEIKAKQYDLVLNGHEVFGGSIRTHDPEILSKIFKLLGHSEKAVKKRFGHLLEAFEYGVPPHGGIAGGFDRFLMAALGELSIREVIPFPTTSQGTASVMDAPSEIDEDQLKELKLKIDKKKQ